MTAYQRIKGEDPAISLCRMVVGTAYESLGANVVDHCKRSIIDTLAVTIGGSAMEGIPAMVELVKDKAGKPESYIPFYGGKVPASEAGLVIGAMSRAMDFGDVHDEASHASEYILPALLAAAGLKARLSGKEFITSFAVGKEVLVRVGIAMRALSGAVPVGMGDAHFIFGSITAAGKLLGLDLTELKHAMGIARAMVQPLDAGMYRYATLMTRLHHGFVCQDAINACLLAKKGVTAYHPELLVGPKGFLGLAKWETNPEDITRDLGEKWEMLSTAMKPYASCKCTHASVQALLELMQEHNFKADDIEGVSFDESTINWLTACIPHDIKWNPQTVPDCQFSLPYVVATAALGYDIMPGAYTPEARAREDVRNLMKKITAKEDPGLPIYTARAHVKLNNGRKYTKECIYIKGHPNNPFTTKDLINKFKQCVPYSAYKLTDSIVERLLDILNDLENIEDVERELIALLVPPI